MAEEWLADRRNTVRPSTEPVDGTRPTDDQVQDPLLLSDPWKKPKQSNPHSKPGLGDSWEGTDLWFKPNRQSCQNMNIGVCSPNREASHASDLNKFSEGSIKTTVPQDPLWTHDPWATNQKPSRSHANPGYIKAQKQWVSHIEAALSATGKHPGSLPAHQADIDKYDHYRNNCFAHFGPTYRGPTIEVRIYRETHQPGCIRCDKDDILLLRYVKKPFALLEDYPSHVFGRMGPEAYSLNRQHYSEPLTAL